MLIKFILLFIVICFLINTGILFARYRMGINRHEKITQEEAKSQSKSSKGTKKNSIQKTVDESYVLEDLSRTYQVDLDVLTYLRKIHHGYAELVPALIVARDAQIEVGNILQQRNKKKTWEDISASYEIEFDSFNAEVASTLKPIKARLPEKIIQERPRFRHDKK